MIFTQTNHIDIPPCCQTRRICLPFGHIHSNRGGTAGQPSLGTGQRSVRVPALQVPPGDADGRDRQLTEAAGIK